ncbi:unnamed protein product [Closterium sp. NIES-64]|nr:unnamed protein product [Closterium sp. NIES-64]
MAMGWKMRVIDGELAGTMARRGVRVVGIMMALDDASESRVAVTLIPRTSRAVTEGSSRGQQKAAEGNSVTRLEKKLLNGINMAIVTCSMAIVTCSMAIVTCSMAIVTCSMAIVTCSMAIVTCSMAIVTCSMANVTCSMAIVTCNMAIVTFSMAIVTCSMAIVTCSMYIVTCSMAIVTCSMAIVTCSMAIVTCSMAIVTCSMAIVTCSMAIVTCSMAIVTCSMAIVTCSMAIVTCSMAIVTCNMAIVTCSMYIVTCSMAIVTCSMAIVTCSMAIVTCSMHGHSTPHILPPSSSHSRLPAPLSLRYTTESLKGEGLEDGAAFPSHARTDIHSTPKPSLTPCGAVLHQPHVDNKSKTWRLIPCSALLCSALLWWVQPQGGCNLKEGVVWGSARQAQGAAVSANAGMTEEVPGRDVKNLCVTATSQRMKESPKQEEQEKGRSRRRGGAGEGEEQEKGRSRRRGGAGVA